MEWGRPPFLPVPVPPELPGSRRVCVAFTARLRVTSATIPGGSLESDLRVQTPLPRSTQAGPMSVCRGNMVRRLRRNMGATTSTPGLPGVTSIPLEPFPETKVCLGQLRHRRSWLL